MRRTRQLVGVKSCGLTLIELMVTIAVLMILALASVPLGRSWVANSHIAEVNDKLNQAFSRARTEAFLNKAKQAGGGVASVRYADNRIEVFDGINADPVWAVDIYPDTTITFDESCGGVISINTDGLIDQPICRSYTISANGGTSITSNLAGG